MSLAWASIDRRWRIAVFWLLLAPIGLVCAIYYLSVPPSPDQSIYDEIGLMSILGHPYYGGTFDLSWPGPFVYHELGVRLFGIHGWTARATDLCLLPIGLFGLWLLAARAGYRAAAAALVLLYPIVYVTSGGWMAGHRDIVGMHMLMLAAALLIEGGRLWRWRRPAAAALVAYATMVRPTYLFALLPFWLIEMWRERDARARLTASAEFVSGAGAVFALFLLGGLRHGTIGDWYEQGVLFPVTVYQGSESRWRLIHAFLRTLRTSWAWLTPAVVTGCLLWIGPLARDDRPKPPLLAYVGSLFITVIVSYVVQNKGYGYHLGGLIPLFLLSAVVGIEAGWRGARRVTGRRALPLYVLLGATVLAVTAGTAARLRHYVAPAAGLVARADADGIAAYVARRDDPLYAARFDAGTIIRSEAMPHDRVLQWGWNFETAFLSGLPTASRFTAVPQFIQIGPHDPHFARWIDEFAREADPARIRFVVLDTAMPPVVPTRDAHEVASPSLKIVRRLVQTGYHERYRGEGVLLLERDRAER